MSQVEYAKASPEDILIRITATNRGAEPATLHVLPTLWFRNTWRTWPGCDRSPRCARWRTRRATRVIAARITDAGPTLAVCRRRRAAAVHRERDEHRARCSASRTRSPYVKDAINDFVVHGRADAVNPEHDRHEGAAHCTGHDRAGGQTAVWRLRLSDRRPDVDATPFAGFDAIVRRAHARGRRVLRSITPPSASRTRRT